MRFKSCWVKGTVAEKLIPVSPLFEIHLFLRLSLCRCAWQRAIQKPPPKRGKTATSCKQIRRWFSRAVDGTFSWDDILCTRHRWLFKTEGHSRLSWIFVRADMKRSTGRSFRIGANNFVVISETICLRRCGTWRTRVPFGPKKVEIFRAPPPLKCP